MHSVILGLSTLTCPCRSVLRTVSNRFNHTRSEGPVGQFPVIKSMIGSISANADAVIKVAIISAGSFMIPREITIWAVLMSVLLELWFLLGVCAKNKS